MNARGVTRRAGRTGAGDTPAPPGVEVRAQVGHADHVRRGHRSFSGIQLRQLRERAGLSQALLAEQVGDGGIARVTASAISHYEAGRRFPDPATLSELARALQVPEKELLLEDVAVAEPGVVPTLRDLRRRAGRTQQEVGDALGLGMAGYSKLERGKVQRVPPGRITTMAGLFHVDEKSIIAALQNPGS